MLTTSDNLFLNKISKNTIYKIPYKKNIESILYYENKYKKNSFDILYEITTEKEIDDWKDMIYSFIKNNHNPKLINKIVELKYYYIYPFINYDELRQIENYYSMNSVFILTNVGTNYKKIIKLLNKKRKMAVLFTDDEKDFELNNEASNVIVINTKEQHKNALYYCDNYLIPVRTYDNSCYSEKIIVIR